MKRLSGSQLNIMNKQLKGISAEEIIQWIIDGGGKVVVVLLDFEPYDCVLEQACKKVRKNFDTIRPGSSSRTGSVDKMNTISGRIEVLKDLDKPDVILVNPGLGRSDLIELSGILSCNRDGILLVNPFYYWSERKMYRYCEDHKDVSGIVKNYKSQPYI